MENKSLGQLEEILYNKVNEQKKIADKLLEAVDTRNRGRVEEKMKDSQASDMRKRLIMTGAFAIGAMVAFFYYNATFGMFGI